MRMGCLSSRCSMSLNFWDAASRSMSHWCILRDDGWRMDISRMMVGREGRAPPKDDSASCSRIKSAGERQISSRFWIKLTGPGVYVRLHNYFLRPSLSARYLLQLGLYHHPSCLAM